MRPKASPARGLGSVLLWLGGLFVLLAVLFDLRLIEVLHSHSELSPEARHETGLSRILFGVVGVALLLTGLFERYRERPLRGRWTIRLALVALAFVLPIFFAERALAPFVEHPTVLFERDPELDWKLRPGAEDFWMGARVSVNDEGLRGPSRAHAKPAGTLRVLFLGDSVTFGARVAADEAILSAQMERALAEDLGRDVEAVNTAVGGYSPWQQALVLDQVGERYDPDVVVLCFVLNDVTEKLELARFGGEREGFQLERMRGAGWRGLWRGTALHHFTRKLGAQLEFGTDVQEGARRQTEIGLVQLVTEPDRAGVLGAWQLTLNSVQEIVDWSRAHEVPLVVAMVPWLPQLETPGFMAPNEHLRSWCARRNVHFLDLAPAMAAGAREKGIPPGDLYVPGDAVHPNEAGHAVLGRAIAKALIELGVLQPD